MSADSAVTYTSVHSEARSWSIPSEDPYEEAAQQLFEQAPRSPEYVPKDHVPVYIPEPEHPEDLVPAEDEAPNLRYPPFFLSHRLLLTTPRPEWRVGRVLLMPCVRTARDPYREDSLDTERRMMTRFRVGPIRGSLHPVGLPLERVQSFENESRCLRIRAAVESEVRALEARVTVALEAGARVDTLEDTGSSS
ncbi:hypothetical protein Tco_0887444 [Tanacetum coccineum]